MTKVFAVLNRYAKFIPPALAVVVYILNNVYVTGGAHDKVVIVTGVLAALGVVGVTNSPSAAHTALANRLTQVEAIIFPFLPKPKTAPPKPIVIDPAITNIGAPVVVTPVDGSPEALAKANAALADVLGANGA